MEPNNNNDIQIMKLKKRKTTKEKFALDEIKRNGIESNTKLTQRNEAKNDINNNSSFIDQEQHIEGNKKKKKQQKKIRLKMKIQ